MRSLVLILLGLMMAATAQAQAVRVDEQDVVAAIKQEFVDSGLTDSDNVELELFGGQTDFKIDNASEAKVMINNLKADEKLGRFSCEAEIFADRKSYAVSSLQGKYFVMAEVWVPAENIAKGEVLTEKMLQSENIRRTRLKPAMVTDKEKLVGQEAKKALKAGKIINDKDVGAKVLVKRNDIVLAVYRTDKMQITAKAIAQQDGAFGERIELQNMKTHKVLTGIVQDAATVVIEQ